MIARELRAHGVDFSFTPVLDVDFGASTVIGDRAFSGNPNASRTSRRALALGLRRRRLRRGRASISRDTATWRRIRITKCRSTTAPRRPLCARLVPFAALVQQGSKR